MKDKEKEKDEKEKDEKEKDIETILFATNFTEQAAHAGKLASEIAKRMGARIVIVHAADEVSESLMPKNQVLRFAKHWLAKTTADVEAAGAPVADTILEQGRAPEVILQTIDEVDANLVVLSTRASDDPGARGLGLIAERVLRRSPVPVLLVPPHSSLEIKKVLCAFDRSESAAHALENAAAFARAFEAGLKVLHVVRKPDVEDLLGYHPGKQLLDEVKIPSEGEIQARIRAGEEFARAAAARLEAPGIDVGVEACAGIPSSEIIALAARGRFDLLVLGAVGRRDNPRVHLGRTAKKVSENLPCAALFLRDADVWQSQIEEEIEEMARNYRRGRQLRKQRKFKQAISKLRRCLAKAPYFAPAIEELSRAYGQSGYKAEAKALSKKARLVREKLRK
jgi:nucleotide-binding universal stress UspA family protein